MPSLVDPILSELDQEAKTTLRVMDRVPEEKFGWKPHDKSMTLGKLASHVATLPGGLAKAVLMDSMDVASARPSYEMKSKAEVMAALNDGIAEAKRIIGGLDDKAALSSWKVTRAGEDLLVIPRIGVVRYFLLNHWYHHRGQLSVYLRMLDIPVPSIYGPSGDENPFV